MSKQQHEQPPEGCDPLILPLCARFMGGTEEQLKQINVRLDKGDEKFDTLDKKLSERFHSLSTQVQELTLRVVTEISARQTKSRVTQVVIAAVAAIATSIATVVTVDRWHRP